MTEPQKKENGDMPKMPEEIQRIVEQHGEKLAGEGKIPRAAGSEEAKKERLQALMSGKEKAPNQFAEYIIQQLRDTISRGQKMGQRLSVLKAQVKQLEEEGLRLEGVADQYLNDLGRWDTPISESQEGEQNENAQVD